MKNMNTNTHFNTATRIDANPNAKALAEQLVKKFEKEEYPVYLFREKKLTEEILSESILKDEILQIQEHNRKIRGAPDGQTIEIHADDKTDTILCKFTQADTTVVSEYVSSFLPEDITDEKKDEFFDGFTHCIGDSESEDPPYVPKSERENSESISEGEDEYSSYESESDGAETVVPSESVSEVAHNTSVVADSSSTITEESLEKTFEAMCNLCELFV